MGIAGPVSSAEAVPEALNAALGRGYSLSVVVNQSDLARATFRRGLVRAIHGRRPQDAAGITIGDGGQ
jgi:hypothetical protein